MTRGFTAEFADHALQRAARIALLLVLVGFAISWAAAGSKAALSFLLGAVLAVINFEWLQFSARKIVSGFLQERPKRKVWPKLFARYVLLGTIAYVIFRGYFVSIPAFVIGLFLPIMAFMCEAAYEAYVAFRHAE